MISKDLDCPDCGRDFAGYSGDDYVAQGAPCPGDDCPSHNTAAFTDQQMVALEKMFQELGKQINERANRDYCFEGSASVEAVANVGSTIENFEPRYVALPDATGWKPL